MTTRRLTIIYLVLILAYLWCAMATYRYRQVMDARSTGYATLEQYLAMNPNGTPAPLAAGVFWPIYWFFTFAYATTNWVTPDVTPSVERN
jgi:hypothetical protein